MKGKNQERISRHQVNRWRRYVSLLVAMILVMGNVLPAVSEGTEPSCGNSGHTHTAECQTETKNLICDLEVTEGHQHGDACYTSTAKLTCNLEENAGHQHMDVCNITTSKLICDLEENAGHVHEESCYPEDKILTCNTTEEGHTHTESCYVTNKATEPKCDQEAGAGAHTHDNVQCYVSETVPNCGKEVGADAHKHTDACYTYEKELTCTTAIGAGAHTHGEGCYETEAQPVTEAPKETEKLVETEAPKETEKPVETEAPKETEKPVETEAPRTGEAVYIGKYIEHVTLESRTIGTSAWNLLANKVTEKTEGLSAADTDELKFTVEFKIPGGSLAGTTSVDYTLPLKSNEAVYQNKEEIVYALDKVTAIGKAVTKPDGTVTITFDETYLKANDNGTEISGTYQFQANASGLAYGADNIAVVAFQQDETNPQATAVGLSFEKVVETEAAPAESEDEANTPATVEETPVEEEADAAPADETPADTTPAEEIPAEGANEDEGNTHPPVDEKPVEEEVDTGPVDETPADTTPVDETPVEGTDGGEGNTQTPVEGADKDSTTIPDETTSVEGENTTTTPNGTTTDTGNGESTTTPSESEETNVEAEPIVENVVAFDVNSGATVTVDGVDVTNSTAMSKNGTIYFVIQVEEGYELTTVKVDGDKDARTTDPVNNPGQYIIERIQTNDTVVTVTTIPMLEGRNTIGEVYATYAEGAVPKGTKLAVSDIASETVSQTINTKLAENSLETAAVYPFEISLNTSDGNEAEISGEISVNIDLAEPAVKTDAANNWAVYHILDDGTVEEVSGVTYEEAVEGDASTITGFSFTASSFSPYVLVETTEASETETESKIQGYLDEIAALLAQGEALDVTAEDYEDQWYAVYDALYAVVDEATIAWEENEITDEEYAEVYYAYEAATTRMEEIYGMDPYATNMEVTESSRYYHLDFRISATIKITVLNADGSTDTVTIGDDDGETAYISNPTARIYNTSTLKTWSNHDWVATDTVTGLKYFDVTFNDNTSSDNGEYEYMMNPQGTPGRQDCEFYNGDTVDLSYTLTYVYNGQTYNVNLSQTVVFAESDNKCNSRNESGSRRGFDIVISTENITTAMSTAQLQIAKYWNDNNNAKRPDSITVKVYRTVNSVESLYMTLVLTEDGTGTSYTMASGVTADKDMKVTFAEDYGVTVTGLPQNHWVQVNGEYTYESCSYTVKEAQASGDANLEAVYGSFVYVDDTKEDSYIIKITNTLAYEKLAVQKVWTDDMDHSEDSVEITLHAYYMKDGVETEVPSTWLAKFINPDTTTYNDVVVTLNASNWYAEWGNMPVYYVDDAGTSYQIVRFEAEETKMTVSDTSVKYETTISDISKEVDAKGNYYFTVTNSPKPSTTSITLSKEVTGNMGDRNKEFSFTATLSEGYSFSGVTYSIDNGTAQSVTATGNSFSFTLKHGQSITFNGLPIGAALTVTENVNGSEYVTTVDGVSGTSKTVTLAATNADIEFVNKKDITIDTGILLDTLPYILLLSVVAVGAVLLLKKRRTFDED